MDDESGKKDDGNDDTGGDQRCDVQTKRFQPGKQGVLHGSSQRVKSRWAGILNVRGLMPNLDYHMA